MDRVHDLAPRLLLWSPAEQGCPPIRDLAHQEVDRQQQTLMPSTLDFDTVRMALALCASATAFRDLLDELVRDVERGRIRKPSEPLRSPAC
ncbi:hypothetical protein ACFQ8C_12330 [Streptomyces sp. NPDC056503]|uniref:hypothetical protein n=1 Tax=Streptomyces sp. NPDC056503 TaxID=3345842 RepID=UPI0036A72CA2